ncbi:hypothetical protein Dsin_029738 [Dipteronia sinensis]|uniref:Pentatricopeptide repeat-containing protein n=1 Tax=Dipteronia sinensis TaxID=43782 RepID=A0AAD9ZUA4_9ROSI|nr:hypothetical protein Dsin_029738 [Dipteronia sinensis]
MKLENVKPHEALSVVVRAYADSGQAKRGDVESANKLFRELKRKGFVPTLETYRAMVNGFCKEGSFKEIDRPW